MVTTTNLGSQLDGCRAIQEIWNYKRRTSLYRNNDQGNVSLSVSLIGGVRHPKIYAYTIEQYKKSAWNGGRKGFGLIKIGETQRDVAVRIR